MILLFKKSIVHRSSIIDMYKIIYPELTGYFNFLYNYNTFDFKIVIFKKILKYIHYK